MAKGTLLVIGAGPAGLTAALEGSRKGFSVTVLESADQVGGLAKTVVHDGNAFDVGGHRFFTKYPQVEAWWRKILGPDLLTVQRQSRIFYRGKFFDYPLRAGNALRNLGATASLQIAASYGWAKIHPRRPELTFEDWVSNRFGRRLFQTFFKTYSEKVWGIPCDRLSADWAAQRIKSLSLTKAVADALGFRRGDVTTLIEQFLYPKRGPGMMWERAQDKIAAAGGRVLLRHRVTEIAMDAGKFAVRAATAENTDATFTADAVISSMALPDLIRSLKPAAPQPVVQAATQLNYRDFLTVHLVVNRENIFPDNWIYLHDPTVIAGRLQNFGNWSAAMVAASGTSCLGLEYFCQAGDDLWKKSDGDLVTLAKHELELLGLVQADEVKRGWVTREPKAYPRYDDDYRANVQTIAQHLATIPRFFTVGRNGMHRYNNQDHSMVTGMLAVENLDGNTHDLWAVNVDDEYHEIKRA
ncbi:MAG: NAD(P)/FAD-dependent oxidoreductase [Patescibacteria group bacterium]|nr:NAD(P)/FAD-dependent oxidoreductase [Patescibacteria group bacterium]